MPARKGRCGGSGLGQHRPAGPPRRRPHNADVIDYTRQDFTQGNERYDLILDIAGNPTLAWLRNALTPMGTAVITGGEEGGTWTGSMDRQLRALALNPFITQRLTMVTSKQRASDLDHLAGLIEAGALTPVIDRTYTLEQVPDAMRYFDAGKACGKIAITIQASQA
jgi:NADPH:quinone reductase-like Zn-dependent oxidoreductase